MPAQAASAPLALRPAEAAQSLGISRRTLFSLTAPRGRLRATKVGRVVLYRICDIEAWLAEQAATRVPAEAANISSAS